MERQILDEDPETVAAMVLHVIQCSGGVLVSPRRYLDGIQALARKYDLRVIADEVITGFWRTGNPFACDTFGVQPVALRTLELFAERRIGDHVRDVGDHWRTSLESPNASRPIRGRQRQTRPCSRSVPPCSPSREAHRSDRP